MDVKDVICPVLGQNVLITPLTLSQVLLQLLRTHFANADKLQFPQLRHLTYKPDSTTNIIIEMPVQPNWELAGRRPSIFITSHEVKTFDQEIAGGAFDGITGKEEQYARVLNGTTAIEVLASNPVETLILACEVYYLLLTLSPAIGKKLPFNYIKVAGLSPLQPLKEGRDHYIIQIPVIYSYNIYWKINEEAPPSE